MRGWPEGFWGKFDNGEPPQWHPLVDHSLDVAACFMALMKQRLLRLRLARLGELEELTDCQVHRLALFALLHDLGKFNLGFQFKVFPRELRPPHHHHAGHVTEVGDILTDPVLASKVKERLPIAEMAEWMQTPETVVGFLCAVFSHHGQPLLLEGESSGLNRRVWNPYGNWDPFAGMAELIGCGREALPLAFQTGGDPLPARPAFQHGFAGLVMLADWLGSNRYWFPYSDPDEGDRWQFSLQRARDALREVGLDVTAARRQVAQGELRFDRVFEGQVPRPMQIETALLELPTDPSVVILESETGSGKTEAAIFHYLRLMQAGAVDSLYFALPTRTAATQIYDRVRQAVSRAFGDATPPVVQAVPGYVRVDGLPAGSLLPEAHHQWDDEESDRWKYRSWAAENPKRFLAAAVAVGTIDQALMAALRVKHAHLRLATLSRSLLVVDEVHASDPYMTGLLRALLTAHREAGGHVLLMSATLGSAARCAYLGAEREPLSRSMDAPYPVLWHRQGETVAPPISFAGTRTKRVAMQPSPIFDAPQEVAREALSWARKGARVLVLRNTVGGAVETQLALEGLTEADDPLLFRCLGVATLHHARFAREDREALDAALEKRFGKDSAAEPGIVVATQTVEQSLDVDFDLLLTDLCPADVLLQRIGRLHRHERPRPAALSGATCIPLTPSERDLTPLLDKPRGGLGSIYADLRIIEATWRLIEKHPVWDIPAMSRELVEEATHSEALEAIAAELGAEWSEHGTEITGKSIAERQQARLNVLDRTKPFGDSEITFPRNLVKKIATRLGTDDRLAEFSDGVPGPFGQSVFSIRLPGHLCRRGDLLAAPDEKADSVQKFTGGFRFAFGPFRFAYDRHGLHRIEE